ncbi:MAG: hypothetical protein GDA51_06510 [Ekhidna sp.]|nr:hypothetical protein [Ekhidna sp.]
MEVAVVLSSRWLNLQGVGNLGGCCGAVVSLVKPPRFLETLEVAAVLRSCWLNLQGVEKPWRFFLWCCGLVG